LRNKHVADSAREKIKLGFAFVGVLILAGVGLVQLQPGGVRASRQMFGWFGSHVQRKLFPEQNADGPTYDETAKAPVSLASGIGQLHAGWPGESVAVVHGAAVEVAAGLLHRGDIEVGSLEGGKFIPWSLTPWQAEEKIRTELMAMPGFLTDENRYVFRRKPTTK
jgi:hypothetical protein